MGTQETKKTNNILTAYIYIYIYDGGQKYVCIQWGGEGHKRKLNPYLQQWEVKSDG